MTETLDDTLPEDIRALVYEILHEACARKLKIASAESCTGGLLASLLTDIDGCAHAFERGFVVYTEEAKEEVLGVPRAMLEAFSAVSREVALAMAQGCLRISRADISLAITGFAGEGGPGEEPGLVHFAISRRDGANFHRVEHFGGRGRGGVRIAALRTILHMLHDVLRDRSTDEMVP